MENKEYRSILERLPIEGPTPQDMAKLCPHLTADEAVKAFTTDSGHVACPSLRIRHGFQIVSYHKEWVEEIKVPRVKNGTEDASVTGTKNHPARLDWSYAGRTRESYADDKSHGETFSPCRHMDEAMRFAESNWGGGLILDNWTSVVEFYVQDPTELVGCPQTKAMLYVTLGRDLNKINNDLSKPGSELLDEAVLQMTNDHVIWAELEGGRGVFTEANCANCGAGLGRSGCFSCGHRFRDDGIRGASCTPLSRKMVAFLREIGHEFKVDPEIAWKKERDNWERVKIQEAEMLRRRQAQQD
jgi:hypothetical protein